MATAVHGYQLGFGLKHIVYGLDELPEGLVDLPTAVQEYGVLLTTLHAWIRRGKLIVHGRRRAPAVGGGYLVVSRSELQQLVDAPRSKGGRPPKAKTSVAS